MLFPKRHSAVLFLVVSFLLCQAVWNEALAASIPVGAAVSPFQADVFSPFVEEYSGIAKVIRIDDQALFVLDQGFVWAITDLRDDVIEVRADKKILEVVSEMRPGNYLVSPYTKSREIQSVEIAGKVIRIETSPVEKSAGAGRDKGQYVGSDSWPYDIPILDISDFVLLNGIVDGVQVTITAEHLAVEMSGDILLGYNFDLIPPDILYLLMEFDSTLNMTMDYSAMVGGAIDHDFDLLTFSIPVYSVGYATINVDVALPTHLTTDGPVCLGGGLSFSFGYSVGIEVLGDEVTPIWTTAPENFDELDPSYGKESNATMRTTLDVGVSASVGIPSVIDLAAASFAIAMYVNTVGVKDPCGWTLDSGVTSNFMFTEFTGLLCGPGDCDWNLFDESIYAQHETCDNLTDNCDCNPTVCPGGCCNGLECVPGNTDELCGADGQACAICGPNKHCVDGECIAACDAELCPDGCCDGTTCRPGNTDAMCGEAGAACDECAGNQHCWNNECQDLCNAELCPIGCCSGQQCEPGNTNEYCGTDGTVCQACEANTHCDAGICVPGADDDTADDDTGGWHDDTGDDADDSGDDTSSATDGGDDDDDSNGGCGC